MYLNGLHCENDIVWYRFKSIIARDVRKTLWQANITVCHQITSFLAACLTYHPKKTFQESLRFFLILG